MPTPFYIFQAGHREERPLSEPALIHHNTESPILSDKRTSAVKVSSNIHSNINYHNNKMIFKNRIGYWHAFDYRKIQQIHKLLYQIFLILIVSYKP